MALEDAKDYGFTACATPPEPFDSASPEEAFINFDFSEYGGLALVILVDSLAHGHEIPVHGISVQASHQGDLGGIQIKGDVVQELLNIASEIFERLAYLLTLAMTRS